MENLNSNNDNNHNYNHNHNRDHIYYNINISQDYVSRFFKKKFKFCKQPDWVLPMNSEDLFENYTYQYASLNELKTHLNDVKSRLNNYPIEEWGLHTRRRNPAGDIIGKIKLEINAEFVTQAWCKFYEILNQYPVVTSSKLNSVHLCEAPGAFISALNHYLNSNYSDVQVSIFFCLQI